MAEQIPAISGIADPEQIRVVIFINNQMVHVPLGEILKTLQEQVDALDTRVTDLETP